MFHKKNKTDKNGKEYIIVQNKKDNKCADNKEDDNNDISKAMKKYGK